MVTRITDACAASAGICREQRLTASGRLTVVEDSSGADAVLSGTVGTNVYGRAAGAAIRLVTIDGRTLWGNEAGGHGFGSASSKIADHLAKELLSAIAEDESKH